MKDLTASQLKKACEIAGNMAKQAKDIIVYQYGIIPVHIIDSYAWYFTIRSAIDGSETHYVDMWTIFSEKLPCKVVVNEKIINQLTQNK